MLTGMKHRTLGGTGLQVSEIALGTEYLIDIPEKKAAGVIRRAIDGGINYFDLFWAKPEFRDIMGRAFAGVRERVYLAAHLGSTHRNGQYSVTRDPDTAAAFFEDFLERYETGYADVLFLHNCDSHEDYDRVMKPGGIKDLAVEYKRAGKAGAIGFSGHTPETSLKAVQSGVVDVLMYPVNPIGHAVEARDALFAECVRRNIGIVAMKPFAGGKLLAPRDSEIMKIEHTGSGERAVDGEAVLSPIQGINYALSTIGVSTVVPGCGNIQELEADLAYFSAPEKERDYSSVINTLGDFARGECVYCNHCLPCPARIDIGGVIRLYETAIRFGSPESARAAYTRLEVSASACTRCGACEKRCPFGVETMEKVLRAAEYFSGSGL
jgi:uncharacterized protein